MSRNESHRLKQLQRSYLMLRLLEVTCLGAGAGLVLLVAGGRAGIGSIDSLVLAGVVAIVIILQRVYSLGLHQLSQQRMASFVNRYYPRLEWSTDLLVTDQPLSGLQLLQREKALAQLPVLSSWRFPHQLMTGVSALVIGLLLFVFVGNEPPDASPKELQVASSSDIEVAAEQPQPVVIENISGAINAPAYTGLMTVAFKSPDIKAAEGSVVSWNVEFSSVPERALIVFSGADSLSLKSDGEWFLGDVRVASTGFYQVAWLDANEWKASDFYKLEVVADLPPQLAVRDLPQFQQFDWDEIEKVNVKADLTDDYGLKDAYLVATVAKGSGESVKFREEKLLFERPTTITGKRVSAERTIDLKKMGLEPGDELYFYVEAWDNKSPVQQTERTETYFLQLNDTASYLVSNDGGLGVDLMPEYFRSQRQIIIDSEKLVAGRGKLKRELFDNTSNGLAHDQKVLRLRYGQFMGEEFESGVVEVQEHEEEGPSTPVDMEEAVKQFGHAHDTENEHNLVPASKEDHHHEGEEENPLEAFAHMHDSQEEATFFIESVKAKLRAALSLMWDAELHLRMNSPEESLPYQYKILKLLKDISNDSRIYVHRTGFDPPPIKEEKRLTGDLKEINPARRLYSSEAPESFPNARKALSLVEKYIQTSSAIPTSSEKEVLQLAGSELAQQAIEFPGKYLESMSLLKSLTDQNGETSKTDLMRIRTALWELIPADLAAPVLISSPVHTLDQQLINRMEAND